jgi:hypothetical protein
VFNTSFDLSSYFERHAIGRFADSPRHEMPQHLFALCLQRFDRYGDVPYGSERIAYAVFPRDSAIRPLDDEPPYGHQSIIERRYLTVRRGMGGWRWVPDHEGDRAAVEAELERRENERVDRSRYTASPLNYRQVPFGEVRLEIEGLPIQRYDFPPTTPIACQGCKHYHGATYNGVRFVCAMHPYGADGDECGDREV